MQRRSAAPLSEERGADSRDGTATASTSGSGGMQTAEEALTDVPDFTPLTNGKGCARRATPIPLTHLQHVCTCI